MYEKTNWVTGDIVTAEKLNKLEDGVQNAGGGGVEFINQTYDDGTFTLDKTYNEISAMVDGGKLPVVIFVEDGVTDISFITGIWVSRDLILGETYIVASSSELQFSADSADGILSTDDGGGGDEA